MSLMVKFAFELWHVSFFHVRLLVRKPEGVAAQHHDFFIIKSKQTLPHVGTNIVASSVNCPQHVSR